MLNVKQLISNLLLFGIALCIVVVLQLSALNIGNILQRRITSLKTSGEIEYAYEEEDLIPSKKCQWPPPETKNIEVNGTFNITLCVQSSRRARLRKREKKYTLWELFGLAKFKGNFTFEELSLLPRQFWGRMRTPEIYLTYPQDVSMRDIVKAVKGGHPVSETPDYNFPITILNTPKFACQKDDKYDLVIVVKSALLAWKVRSTFREYIHREAVQNSQMKIGVVFSMGLP
ncbi:hypothetical protein TSMEX_000592, partial [Taenia solium]|eukprot:TsM_000804500 transcript=TsM_000804500 gene=TsM_000804500